MSKLDRATLDEMATRKPVGGSEVELYKRALRELLADLDAAKEKRGPGRPRKDEDQG